MKNISSLACSKRRFLLGLAVVGALAVTSAAQTAPAVTPDALVKLDQLVISASRTPQDARYTPSSVSVIPLADVFNAQITSLQAALSQQPGVIIFNLGATGSQSSVLMRGANAEQTLFVVDGVRMNDRSAAYLNFLGAADLGGIDRIEVLRGPQSTLYGSSAMGGVIRIETERATGASTGALSATAGSFASYGASAAGKGATGALGYSASLGHYHTANDRARNDFDQWACSLRLDYAVTPSLLVGTTFRGQTFDYDEPGSRLYPYAGSVKSNTSLATVYGQVEVSDAFTSRLTLASHLREYTYLSPGVYAPQHNNRNILDWQNTWSATKQTEIVAGANFENSRYTVSGISSTDRVEAGYISVTERPIDSLTLTGGLRHDGFKSVGGATTGRLGLAWLPSAGTKLRATYGTGFNAPGSSDRYGVPEWGQLPNPNLVPEKSRGWDAGIDQDFMNGTATLGVTYFQNRFRNLFDWEYVSYVTYEGRTINSALATTEGVEVATTLRPNSLVTTRASYTYLEAHNDITGARLSRRPRHSGDIEIQFQATKKWRLGAGLHVVACRDKTSTPAQDYATARLFTSYALRPDLLLKFRVENLLNKSYEEAYGYPALPRSVFAGIEWRF